MSGINCQLNQVDRRLYLFHCPNVFGLIHDSISYHSRISHRQFPSVSISFHEPAYVGSRKTYVTSRRSPAGSEVKMIVQVS